LESFLEERNWNVEKWGAFIVSLGGGKQGCSPTGSGLAGQL